jgi:hypothetical protein
MMNADLEGYEALIYCLLNKLNNKEIVKQILHIDPKTDFPTAPPHVAAFSIIFNPVFGKAFFGEDLIGTGTCNIKDINHNGNNADVAEVMIPAWQWHFQEMIKLDDPFKYIRKFL